MDTCTAFEAKHQEVITGKLTTFDRMIFKGYLTGFFGEGRFQAFLSRQGVLLKDFGKYVERATAGVKAHAERLAADSGRPFIYLRSATTKASGESKGDLARQIAVRDRITEGLVCVFSVLEPCRSFDVRGNRETKRLEVVRRERKCLHFYFYYIDPEFGFLHVRLQSWFPFEIQIWINGREWLAHRLDSLGIRYERYENSFQSLADLKRVQSVCTKFAHRRWPRALNALARRVNPLLPFIERLGFGGYYWVFDQTEISTDIMFRDRKSLEAILPDLLRYATLALSAEDVLRFLGRKLHGKFKGELTTSLAKRPRGWRVKHRMKRNSIKLYDKGCVLRIETTINNPREFKVLKRVRTRRGDLRRWLPMGKGVANLWRYAQVGELANRRYLEALAQVQPQGKAVSELERLCRSRVADGRRYAKFNPVSAEDSRLFAAALAGEHLINGFRNRDLAARLHPAPAYAPDARRRCARLSRLIRKLRGHQLIAKVPHSRLYRVTARGSLVMSAALHFRHIFFPEGYAMPS